MLWSWVQGHDSWRMAARLCEAGLAGDGSATEEAVVSAITLALRDGGGKTAFVKRRRTTAQKPERSDTARSVPPDVMRAATHRALASGPSDRETYMALPAVCSNGLRRHARRDGRGSCLIDELSMFAVDPRTANKHLARSEMHRRLQQWIESADAEAWRESRAGLFGAGAADGNEGSEGGDDEF